MGALAEPDKARRSPEGAVERPSGSTPAGGWQRKDLVHLLAHPPVLEMRSGLEVQCADQIRLSLVTAAVRRHQARRKRRACTSQSPPHDARGCSWRRKRAAHRTSHSSGHADYRRHGKTPGMADRPSRNEHLQWWQWPDIRPLQNVEHGHHRASYGRERLAISGASARRPCRRGS